MERLRRRAGDAAMSFARLILRRLVASHLLHGGQGFLDMVGRTNLVVRRREGGCDLTVGHDDERRAFRELVIDLDSPRVLHAWFDVHLRQAVGRGDGAVRIGGYRNFAGAILRVRRKGVQTDDAVARDADD